MAIVLAPSQQHAFTHPAAMPLASFKGDSDALLGTLIAASRKREVSDADLKERALVPFQFDSDAPPAAAAKALETTRARRTDAGAKPAPTPAQASPQPQQHGQKRGAERSAARLPGSPPKKENERQQGRHQPRKPASPTASAASSAAPSAAGGKQGRKHHREPSAKSLAALAAGQGGRQSPPHKRPEVAQPRRATHPGAPAAAPAALVQQVALALAAAVQPPGSASKFAGPAFTNSPTPDSLPIPTSSLLTAQAADALRATLQL